MNIYPIVFIIALFGIALYFIFRKKKIEVLPLTKADRKLLNTNVRYYEHLNSSDKRVFEQKVALFLASVKIEGVGLTVTQLDRLLVAASAVIPIFGFDNFTYKNLGSVVLYPDTFNKDFQFDQGQRETLGMVGTGFLNGQMILSKAALYHGFSKSAGKENTGIHEFVHLLDATDGAIDGIPENLMSQEYTQPWIDMMHQEIKQIEKNKSDINPYAITNEAEFFAVAAEYFFEQPESFKNKHPELYEQLSRVFLQDLAATTP